MKKQHKQSIFLSILALFILLSTIILLYNKENKSITTTELGRALLSNEVVVNTYAELNTALSVDNGITNVYLGSDILVGVAGVIINRNKPTIIVDGRNPLDETGTIHTLTDAGGGAVAYTIGVTVNNGTKHLTVKNMNIISKNYYGLFCIYDVAIGVTLSYENVNYRGPQMTYNRNGTSRYIDCDISIEFITGGSVMQEMGEVLTVEIGGNTKIIHGATTANSMFWFVSANPSVRFLPNSHVTIIDNGTFMFYTDTNPSIEIGENAVVDMDVKQSLFYGATPHNAKSFIIRKGASLQINQRENVTGYALIRLSGNMKMEPDSRMYITKKTATSTSPLFNFIATGLTFDFDNPASVVLYNQNGSIFTWNSLYTITINISSKLINYWNIAKPFPEAGTVTDIPNNSWSKADKTTFTLTSVSTNAAADTITSNFIPGVDNGVQPSPDNFKTLNVRVLVLSSGNIPLHINPVYENDSAVEGTTRPHIPVTIAYQDNSDNLVQFLGASNSLGVFRITVGNTTDIIANKTISVSVNYDFITKIEAVLVNALPTVDFELLPTILSFQQTQLTNREEIISRTQTDWGIRIVDHRNAGSYWALSVFAVEPLKSAEGNILPNALIFVDKNNNERIIGESPIQIYERTTAVPGEETLVNWDSQHGILLKVDLPYVVLGTYTTTLIWILSDAP